MMPTIKLNNFIVRIITAAILGFSFWTLFFYCPPFIFSGLLIIALGCMLYELKQILLNSPQFFLIIAPVYPIIPCLILIYFNQSSCYKILLYHLFIIVFTFDSASYIFGKIYSKIWITHKIIPSISPGKSWQGAIGGYITTIILTVFIRSSDLASSFLSSLFVSTIICVVAFAGDIFESYLKRSAGVKDSGKLLPGHGGFLDRFDSILFVSYFFFIFRKSLLMFFQ